MYWKVILYCNVSIITVSNDMNIISLVAVSWFTHSFSFKKHYYI